VEKRFRSSLRTKGGILDKIKAFLMAFGAGILTAVFFFLRRKDESRSHQVSKIKVEKDQSDMKLKEIEARRELEKNYHGLSDSDIVLRAINERVVKASDSDSDPDKGSR